MDSDMTTGDKIIWVASVVGYVVAFMVVMMLVVMVVVMASGAPRTDHFRIGGFQLGSYDPARYPSEIVRRP